jgi:tetratricopeptide (TPR) repeat protein
MWQQALETLQKAERMQSTPDDYHRIYLVLANWRLGRNLEALKHWVQFVSWMERTRPSFNGIFYKELDTLRAEAEGLLGEYRDLESAYREIIRLEPNSALAYLRLAKTFSQSGEWAGSAAAYVKAFDMEEPTDLRIWIACACSLLQAGDTEGYRKLCERMLKRYGQSTDVNEIAFLAHVCVLAPDSLADNGRVLQLARQRSDLTADIEVHGAWSAHILGLACYRAGKIEEAAARLESAQTAPDLPVEIQLSNSLALAMCRRLGQEIEAAAAIERARAGLAALQSELGQEFDIAEVPRILLREAETLLPKQ